MNVHAVTADGWREAFDVLSLKESFYADSSAAPAAASAPDGKRQTEEKSTELN